MRNRRALKERLNALEEGAAEEAGASPTAPIAVCGMDRQPLRVWRIGDGEVIAANEASPDVRIPERLEPLLWPKRYKVVFGGRGSAKTRSIVAILVERARSRFERILCCREIQKSIEESSHQEIKDEIERRGLGHEFNITDRKITHHGTGSRFSFEGLYRNQTKIKGYAGATLVWVEEAENISQKSWNLLGPTIRAKGSEIWVSFNPATETDPTWVEHVEPFVREMEDGHFFGETHTVIKINHSDNPWLTDELIMEREKMRETDHDRYLWIWEGEFFNHSDAQVMSGKWTIKEFDAEDLKHPTKAGPNHRAAGPYYGADWGFAKDPTTLVRCWIWQGELWIDYAISKVGLDVSDTPEFFDHVPGARDNKIWADCARPETINHIKKSGFMIDGATKWQGSVEDGVAFLRGFKRINIHPRCKAMIEEAKNWKYQVDRLTDEVKNKLEDGNDHCWDAIRYALHKQVMASNGSAPISSWL